MTRTTRLTPAHGLAKAIADALELRNVESLTLDFGASTAARITTSFYLDEDQLDRVAAAVAKLCAPRY